MLFRSYYPPGSKISIGNNVITIQKKGIFQGFVRNMYGDNKNDINILLIPLLYACKTYLKSDTYKKYHILFRKAVKSCVSLKETYNGTEALFAIDQIINMINTHLDNKEYSGTIISSYNSDSGQLKQKTYEHFGRVWTEERLNILFGLVHEIDKNNNVQYVETLDSFMKCMDKHVRRVVIEI